METFLKTERLRDRKQIAYLFENGAKIRVPGFLVFWRKPESNDTYTFQLLIAVSKKQFHQASKRNRIRRQIREAIRKNKSLFVDYLQQHQQSCRCVVVYSGPEMTNFADINNKIVLILHRLQAEYEKAAG